MPLSINTNLASMTAQRSFLNSNSALETAFERLSTGKRVNSAADDAAGLAIGKDLESRVNGLNQAIRNVNDGISMVQITEGTLDEVTTILQRMRDLAVQASNASLSSTERGYLDSEQAKLATTLDSVLDQAKFNNIDLVSTTSNTRKEIHSGADAGDTIVMDTKVLSASVLGVTSSLDLANSGGSAESVAFSPTMHKAATAESVALGVSAYGGTNASTTFTLTVGSETYVTSALDFSSGTEAAKQDLVVNALTAATGTTSGQTLAQDLGITVAEVAEAGDIKLTYGTNTNVSETTYSLTVDNSGGTIGSAVITDGSSGSDTYSVTIGNSTYSTGSVAYTNNATDTATAIQTALRAATDSTTGQTMLQDLGVTATVTNGSIVLAYADNENVAESTYTLAVGGTGAAAAGVAAVITDGSNTARTAITTIDSALDSIASERAKLGATQAQLESTVRNLANVAENTSAAAGRIMDTDYAAETANLTKAQILQQAATSILAQANAQPQAVLSLLQ
jgi:flagellin